MTVVNNKEQGFTLIELMIVVVILSVLAAIVAPQFGDSSDEARQSALASTLAGVRAAIELYKQQHGEYPGANTAKHGGCAKGVAGTGEANQEQAWLDQMTYYTDADGLACTIAHGDFKYGPYLKDGIPGDPFKGVATITMSGTGNLVMSADGTAGGWKYDYKTGKFIVNHTSYDDL